MTGEYPGCFECKTGQFRPSVVQNNNPDEVSGDQTDPTTCIACKQGQAQAKQGAASCLACEPGQTQSQIGQTSCKKCPKGRYKSSSKSIVEECDNCSQGQYQSQTGETGCRGCGPGMWSSQRGLANESQCTQCSAGRYSTATGAVDFRTCVECQPGKKSNQKGASSEETCINCGKGHYRKSGTVATQCRTCSSGKYQTEEGQASCLPCTPGEYQNENGQQSCNLCNLNEKSEQSGSASCEKCKVGSQAEPGNAKCEICGAGQFGLPSGGCTACSVGQSRSVMIQNMADKMAQMTSPAGDDVQATTTTNNNTSLPNITVDDDQPGQGGYPGQTDEIDMPSCTGDIDCLSQCVTSGMPYSLCSTFKCSNSRCIIISDEKEKKEKEKEKEKKDDDDEADEEDEEEGDASNSRSGLTEEQEAALQNEETRLLLDAAQCVLCRSGMYNEVRGAATCLPCIPGMYNDEQGLTECKNCPTNTFSSDRERETLCTPCSIGRSADPGSTKCSACTAGTFANSDDQCIACAPGTFTATQEQVFAAKSGNSRPATQDQINACAVCPRGYYQDTQKQTSCLPCMPGSFNDQLGSTSCQQCAANTFSEQTNRTIPCNACAIGRQSKQGSVTCSSCQPGQFIGVGDVCEICPRGYISDSINAPSCSLCSRGETAATEGSALCLGCDLGTYGLIEGFCSDCPVGKYQDGRGQTKCLGCPQDTYGTETGKTSGADCEPCPDKTTTNFTTGKTDVSACMCSAGHYFEKKLALLRIPPEDKCVPCLQDKTRCTDANTSLAEMETSPGWWRQHKKDTHFFQCSTMDDCVGGKVGHQCRIGNQGVLCAVCSPNHVRIEGICSECGDISRGSSDAIMLIAALPLLLLFVGMLFYLCRANNAKRVVEDSRIDLIELERGIATVKVVPRAINKKSLKATTQKINAVRALQGSFSTNETLSVVGDVLEDQLRGQARLTDMIANATGDTAGGVITVENERTTSMGRRRAGVKSTGGTGSVGNRIRILIGYVQITAALVFSFDVPWPPMTKELLRSLSFINFNFMDFIAPVDPCLFHSRFLDQCMYHMAILPCCACVILTASILARMRKKTPSVVWPKAKSVMVTLVFLLVRPVFLFYIHNNPNDIYIPNLFSLHVLNWSLFFFLLAHSTLASSHAYLHFSNVKA